MAEIDVSKPKEPPKPVQIGGESLVDRILPHLKKIIIGVIVLAFVATVIWGTRAYFHHRDEKKTEKLAEVMRTTAQQPVALEGAKPDPKHPAYADPTERDKAILDALAKQGTNPPGHAYRASLLLGAGNVDSAIEEYKKGQDAKGIEGVLSREGLGIALEAKAATEQDAAARDKLMAEALATYQRMQPDEKGPRRVYALYHEGRILDETQKKAEAKAAFEKAMELLSKEEQHELRDLLQKRLAALGGP
jgi:tetratricopeptide (TPR) repeat protein